MILIGEKLNGFIPSAGRAIQKRDEGFVARWARAQASAGADYLDVCAATAPEGELDALLWLMGAAEAAADTPLSLDSPNPRVLAEAIRRAARPGLVNSVSLEGEKINILFPLAAELGFGCVALLCARTVPETARERLKIFETILARAQEFGIPEERLFIDPLVTALASDENACLTFAECLREIRRLSRRVHLVGGMSNVSFRLPARAHVNRAFMAMAIQAGLDSAILDPTDGDMMGVVYASEALTGVDEMCGDYMRAFRAGKFAK